ALGLSVSVSVAFVLTAGRLVVVLLDVPHAMWVQCGGVRVDVRIQRSRCAPGAGSATPSSGADQRRAVKAAWIPARTASTRSAGTRAAARWPEPAMRAPRAPLRTAVSAAVSSLGQTVAKASRSDRCPA